MPNILSVCCGRCQISDGLQNDAELLCRSTYLFRYVQVFSIETVMPNTVHEKGHQGTS
jgi:hypothetical protein